MRTTARSCGRRGCRRVPSGGAITFAINGRQYVAIAAGGGPAAIGAPLNLTPEADSVNEGNVMYVFALPQ